MTQTTSHTNSKKYNKKLSIQFSLNGLSFCIIDTLKHKISAFETIDFDRKLNPYEGLERLMHYFDNRAYLKSEFDEVLVVHDNNLSALVPKSIFNEAHLADYLKFNAKILQSDHISYEPLEFLTAVNVYVPYVNINNFIYDKFGAFTYKHSSTILIDTVIKKGIIANNTAEKVYVHITNKHFEIVVTKGSQLVLYNTFDFNNIEDFAYYVLFTLEQLNYDTNSIEVVLAGNVNEIDGTYMILYKYIRNISIDTNQSIYTVDNPDSKQSNFTILNSI